ncbi:unnamed protein product [Tilletia controversa]|uniref:Uncharacterized protein n=1 Tax=Tilletia controversa TaxID=13291 RepID=A0A8X7T0A1_9BASI|nr:hypothetical protein CF328_g744 [Tilletia controversa]KAE8254546.1 hypothetical protein A4X06_0g847 [Tilletia controversa]CAD6899119.1 unnamed protein product [Tilletia controversa]CAD6936125.1 unnamed protein product [Tilletia controversa]CAD6969909.1 unnamed protein product [Tilletia controversa]
MSVPERRRPFPSSNGQGDEEGEAHPSPNPRDTKPPQPPRQHNSELAARYSRTMAEAQAYHNPPILRRALLVLFVVILVFTASRLQLRARSQVKKWRYHRALSSGEWEEGWEPALESFDGDFAGRSIWESFGWGGFV